MIRTTGSSANATPWRAERPPFEIFVVALIGWAGLAATMLLMGSRDDAWLAGGLVVAMTIFGAGLGFSISSSASWGRKMVIFPMLEWSTLGGALLGAACACQIWFGLFS